MGRPFFFFIAVTQSYYCLLINETRIWNVWALLLLLLTKFIISNTSIVCWSFILLYPTTGPFNTLQNHVSRKCLIGRKASWVVQAVLISSEHEWFTCRPLWNYDWAESVVVYVHPDWHGTVLTGWIICHWAGPLHLLVICFVLTVHIWFLTLNLWPHSSWTSWLNPNLSFMVHDWIQPSRWISTRLPRGLGWFI